MADGLQYRPVLDTVADTWEWMNGPDGRLAARTDRPSVGLDPEVEAQILAGR
jgi:2'-hydroxyisoflavone reductase